MIYLASPYSDPSPAVRQNRYEAAMACIAWLVSNHQPAISPIVHFHEVAIRHNLPTDADFWSNLNRRLFSSCTEMAILTLPGYWESHGVNMELRWAEARAMPIYYIDQPNGDFQGRDLQWRVPHEPRK